MKYNSAKHHRRSSRLKGYNYASIGFYFVTINTYQRQWLFGTIAHGVVNLSDYGKIASDCWLAIPKHYPTLQIDTFVIMPNHIHGILIQTSDEGRDRWVSGQFGKPQSQSIGTVIGSFKSATTRRINLARNSPGSPVWLRNYHDRIIRDDLALHRIRHYIDRNPIAWSQKYGC